MESRKLKICRLCLCENECFINIFELNDWQGYVAAEVISDLLRFQVSEIDGYPHVVCPKCLMNLTEFKQFKERCQKSKTKYDDMVASSEALLDQQEMVEFVAVKTEPVFYSESDNYVSKDIGDGGRNLELCQIDPLGESSSHAELIDSEPSGSSGTIQSTATVMEKYPMAMLKQENLENDSTSGDGSEEKRGTNIEGNFGPIILKREVLSLNADSHTQETRIKSKKTRGNVRTVELAGTSIVEDSREEDREWRPAPFAGRKDRFQCQKCKKVLKTKNGLRSHLAAHGIGTFHKCTVCSKIFGSKAGLVNHARIHMGEKPFICDECSASFTEYKHLKVHMRVHSKLNTYVCKECGSRFSHQCSLTRHMSVHTNLMPYSCNVCHANFSDESALRNHMTVHEVQKLFACDACSKRYGPRAIFRSDVVVQTGGSPHKCDYCSKRFRWKVSLDKHFKNV